MKVKSGRPMTVGSGDRFGMLTVVSRLENGPRRQVVWLCKCDCGKEKAVRADSLRAGKVRSCGCLRKERMRLAAELAGTFLRGMEEGDGKKSK